MHTPHHIHDMFAQLSISLFHQWLNPVLKTTNSRILPTNTPRDIPESNACLNKTHSPIEKNHRLLCANVHSAMYQEQKQWDIPSTLRDNLLRLQAISYGQYFLARQKCGSYAARSRNGWGIKFPSFSHSHLRRSAVNIRLFSFFLSKQLLSFSPLFCFLFFFYLFKLYILFVIFIFFILFFFSSLSFLFADVVCFSWSTVTFAWRMSAYYQVVQDSLWFFCPFIFPVKHINTPTCSVFNVETSLSASVEPFDFRKHVKNRYLAKMAVKIAGS